MKTCTHCKNQFEITEDDKKAFEQFQVLEPNFCPDCRQQRRLSFRNERNFYQRTCDLCKKSIVSLYSPDKKYTVYCSSCWWGDAWNAKSYGRDFDFSRPFFDQFEELLHQVPLPASTVSSSTNSEFNTSCVNSKDIYLSARVAESENILYSHLAMQCLGCVDGFDNFSCQYCYECVDCWNCYESYFCQICRNTSNSAFCYDCVGCNNCFGCVGLRNAQYYFFNEKCTPEEYQKRVAEWKLSNIQTLRQVQQKFRDFLIHKPKRAVLILHSENANGDYITDSKNVFYSFDVEKTDTCRYSWGTEYAKDIYDGSFIHYGENCYDTISNNKSTNIMFSFVMFAGVYDTMYSMICFNNSHHLFGCVGMKKEKYCILNKEYTKEEYEALVPKIIEHMRKTGEYGEFFPAKLSTFGYNESVAQNYMRLTQQQAMEQGFHWKEKDTKEYQPQTYQIPDDINDTTSEILNQALACESCGRNYKIIAKELEFYQKSGITIPRKCFLCRHYNRIQSRNPRKLWNRNCMKCNTEVQSSYDPERPDIIYCENCYLEAR